MIRLTSALQAWGTAEFSKVLKQEIEQLHVELLPLQQALSTSSYAVDNKLKAMIIQVSDDTNAIHAKVGLFYSGIIAGCSCADDPTQVDEQSEYCEVQFAINKNTADTTVILCED